MSDLALVINHPWCSLPEASNDYFSLDSYLSENVEGGLERSSFRVFVPKHIQSHEFISKMGIEDTFTFYRVLLSFYDASFMLFSFSEEFKTGSKTYDFNQIELLAQNYDIEKYNYTSLDRGTYLCLYDLERDREVEHYPASVNNFQELFWVMNLEQILSNYGINYYPKKKFTNEEKIVSNKNLLIYKMLKNREIAMVMHTWRKLNSYNNADFIVNISNILEYIKEDLEKNRSLFDQTLPAFKLLEDLIHLVHKTKRLLFFGIFNNSNIFGFFSRHGSSHLVNYNKINQKTNLNLNSILKNMNGGIMPNNEELRYMFNIWHLTTSLIVSNWFISRKIETL